MREAADRSKGGTTEMREALRRVSLAMLAAAVICVGCTLSAPNLGRTVYIGSFKFGVELWRLCYALYVLVMAGLFVASFLVKGAQASAKGPKRPE